MIHVLAEAVKSINSAAADKKDYTRTIFGLCSRA